MFQAAIILKRQREVKMMWLASSTIITLNCKRGEEKRNLGAAAILKPDQLMPLTEMVVLLTPQQLLLCIFKKKKKDKEIDYCVFKLKIIKGEIFVKRKP